MNRRTFHPALILALVSLTAQFATMAAITHLRGSPLAYAFQSPDSAEYVVLAYGLAQHGRFVQLDADGRPAGPPDTWRVPGYPLFLAAIIRYVGDSPVAFLLAQQLVAALTVPLLYWILVRVTSSRLSIVATIAWMLDPFRLYYSQWLLAETLFLFLFLAALLAYVRARERGFSPAPTLALGLLAGATVMVRPIGILLPLLAVAGAACQSPERKREVRSRSDRMTDAHASSGLSISDRCRRWLPAVLCAAGAAAIICPWLARNHAVAGHWSLSSQSGASFAYHKVTDVILWSQGRHRYRFDAGALDEVRSVLDQRLRQDWQQRFGPLTSEQREALSWQNLNRGRSDGIDPFVASSLLWRIGLEQLASRKTDLLACYTVQGIGMLTFPLNLVLDPPAGQGSAPLSLLGGGNSVAARAVAVLLGSAYAALAIVVLVRLITAAAQRRWSDHFFAFWPALLLFVFSLPFEDPRFRLPLIPLFLLLAIGQSGKWTALSRPANDRPTSLLLFLTF